MLIEALGSLWRMLGGVVREVFSTVEKCHSPFPVKASKLLRERGEAVGRPGHQCGEVWASAMWRGWLAEAVTAGGEGWG